MFAKPDNNDNVSSDGLFIRSVRTREAYGQGRNVLNLSLVILCLFVCGISLTSGQLFSELTPDCTRSCFSQVLLRRRGGDCILR